MRKNTLENMSFGPVYQFLEKVHHRLFLAPFGYGKPLPKEELDKGYETGVWSFLNSLDELANYMVVVGYIRHFSKMSDDSPKILDLGCGIGNVTKLLEDFSKGKYTGLDISDTAVMQAQERNFENAEFYAGAFEDWETEEKFDFIISTGAIHYAENPLLILQKYSKNLKENGKFVISLWRYGQNKAIWRKIEKHFEVVDSTVVKNHKGIVWDIKVLR